MRNISFSPSIVLFVKWLGITQRYKRLFEVSRKLKREGRAWIHEARESREPKTKIVFSMGVCGKRLKDGEGDNTDFNGGK